MNLRRLALAVVAAIIGAGCGGGVGPVTPTPTPTPLAPTPIPTPTPVSFLEVPLGTTPESDAFSQMGQTVAALPNGDIATVWQQGVMDSAGVFVQVLDPQGRPRLGTHGLTLDPRASEPSVVAHVREGAYAAYCQRNGRGTTDVVVQRLDRNGSPLWPGGVIAASSARPQSSDSPYLAPDPTGGVYVCAETTFDGYRPGELPHNLRCQRLSEDGRRLWTDAGLEVAPPRGWRVLPRAMVDSSGGLLVFWADYGDIFDNVSVPIRMEGQRFSPNGDRLWGSDGLLVHETGIAESNGHSYRFFDAVPDRVGGAILVFDDASQAGNADTDVLAQRVSETGQLLWGSGAIVSAKAGNEYHDATIATCAGCAAVAVSELESPTANRLTLYMLGPDGRHLWPSQGVTLSTSGAQNYAATGSYDNGILRVAWTRQAAVGSWDFDIVWARFQNDGSRLPGNETFADVPAGRFSRGSVFQGLTSLFVVTWDDIRASGSLAVTDAYLGIRTDRAQGTASWPRATFSAPTALRNPLAGSRRMMAVGERTSPGERLQYEKRPGPHPVVVRR
jgi:hypothetical protein